MFPSELSIDTVLHFTKDDSTKEVVLGQVLYRLFSEFPCGFYAIDGTKLIQKEHGEGPTEYYFTPNILYKACTEAGLLDIEIRIRGKAKRRFYKISKSFLESYSRTGVPMRVAVNLPPGLWMLMKKRSELHNIPLEQMIQSCLAGTLLQNKAFVDVAQLSVFLPEGYKKGLIAYVDKLKEITK